MNHPGLPEMWAWSGVALMLLVAAWHVLTRPLSMVTTASYSLQHLPLISAILDRVRNNAIVLVTIRSLVAILFIVVIVAGLIGSPMPERNLATTLTWTVWWSGVVIAVFFLGSMWCAVCPWDTLASWLVKRRLVTRTDKPYSLDIKVPAWLRNLSVASVLFIVLTWLELGYGVTVSPYATAMVALGFVVMAVFSMLVFERKAFCQYFCPVGRTVGVYSEMSMTALRPVDPDVCAKCTTLECYHGNEKIDACPTHQVMGRIKQNSFCVSCGQCVLACPHKNISWAVRSPISELSSGARAGSSETVFLLVVLSLTLFHGLTMLPAWQGWLNSVASYLNDSGRLLLSFSVLMLMCIGIVMMVYMFASWVTSKALSKRKQIASSSGSQISTFRQVFTSLGFATLPITFAYHVAHNLTHLFTETRGFTAVLLNPLGTGTAPLSMEEAHLRHTPLISQNIIYSVQLLLIVVAFVMAIRVAYKRLWKLVPQAEIQSGNTKGLVLPQVIYLLLMSGLCLWLLSQPMAMRMPGM